MNSLTRTMITWHVSARSIKQMEAFHVAFVPLIKGPSDAIRLAKHEILLVGH